MQNKFCRTETAPYFRTIKTHYTMFMTPSEIAHLVNTLDAMKAAVATTEAKYNDLLQPEAWGDTGNHEVDPALVQLEAAIAQMKAAVATLEAVID